MILQIYAYGLRAGKIGLKSVLKARRKAGKEPVERFKERLGRSDVERPSGSLVWVHAASVGEAQSSLVLIRALLAEYPSISVLVTTGTVTSANIMEKTLPSLSDGRAFHQFYPLDHPEWVASFLNHWQPDLVLWMESELWPNMLFEIQNKNIPAVLVNARLSKTSYRNWSFIRKSAKKVLKTFSCILCQSDQDADYYKKLGAINVHVTDNLKFSAEPLGTDEADLGVLTTAIGNRPCWVYASTHADEEVLAAHIHQTLKTDIPDLLTIIVPRHPARRDDIQNALKDTLLNVQFRGKDRHLPNSDTDIYIADTLGELGLFYRVCPIACIGRTFSTDGGGGHNPIEPAQLDCAVLHGPMVQNLKDIFDDMYVAEATLPLANQREFERTLNRLFSDEQYCKRFQKSAYDFAQSKAEVLERVLQHIKPLVVKAVSGDSDA